MKTLLTSLLCLFALVGCKQEKASATRNTDQPAVVEQAVESVKNQVEEKPFDLNSVSIYNHIPLEVIEKSNDREFKLKALAHNVKLTRTRNMYRAHYVEHENLYKQAELILEAEYQEYLSSAKQAKMLLEMKATSKEFMRVLYYLVNRALNDPFRQEDMKSLRAPKDRALFMAIEEAREYYELKIPPLKKQLEDDFEHYYSDYQFHYRRPGEYLGIKQVKKLK